jgi:hypothetical protein
LRRQSAKGGWSTRLFSAAGFISLAKGTLEARLSLSLVMESAIAMSKIDPKTVPRTRPSGG